MPFLRKGKFWEAVDAAIGAHVGADPPMTAEAIGSAPPRPQFDDLLQLPRRSCRRRTTAPAQFQWRRSILVPGLHPLLFVDAVAGRVGALSTWAAAKAAGDAGQLMN